MCYVCIAYFSHWSFLISPLLFCSIQIHRMNKHFRLWSHILCCSFKFAFTDLFPDVSYSCYSIFSFMCNILWIVVCPFVFFFWPLCCLSSDLLILITSLVSSNSSQLQGGYRRRTWTRPFLNGTHQSKINSNKRVPYHSATCWKMLSKLNIGFDLNW